MPIAPKVCGKFDERYFWRAVGDMTEKKKLSSNLLFTKYIYLDGDDKRDCVLNVGVIPHKRFSIGARIEMKNSNRVLYLDKATLLNLLECIDEMFSENAVYPKSCRSVRIRMLNEKFYVIYVCAGIEVGNNAGAAVDTAEIDSEVFEQIIEISECALLTLRNKHSIVKKIVDMFECNSNYYESQLHKLLTHFCYDADDRMVLNAIQRPTQVNKRHFNDVLCTIDCHCIDKRFVVGVINECSDWFLACVPLFIRTLMLDSN